MLRVGQMKKTNSALILSSVYRILNNEWLNAFLGFFFRFILFYRRVPNTYIIVFYFSV